ncbi:MAG TPA: GNAT family N-acetyltransferase [Bacteroidota bacterium]|nr:GNAT family N-acetyltransferase [Bacteroidota bacterium]
MADPSTVRRAVQDDLEAITAIYNEAVLTTTATFDTEPKTAADRLAWFRSHGGRFTVLVAEVDGRVAGWASLSPWSDRPAYDDTAETSVYVGSAYRGRGIGRSLYAALIAGAKEEHFHTLLARVAGESEASLRLHERCGFRTVGTMKEVGRKFGRLLDVHLLQLMLE